MRFLDDESDISDDAANKRPQAAAAAEEQHQRKLITASHHHHNLQNQRATLKTPGLTDFQRVMPIAAADSESREDECKPHDVVRTSF